MWKVVLIKSPTPFPWKPDYFPREFAYKKDALALKKLVEESGGTASVEKTK